MPAPQLHLTFSMHVQDQRGIAPALRHACAVEPVYTRLGAIVHDLPYYGNMLIEAIRYGLDAPALDEPWAYRVHSVRPERFVASFVRAAATVPVLTREERLALVGGLMSHCALDLTLHPLVNYCARRDTARFGGHESVHHRRAEKYHALFFHLERLGRDPIGSPDMRAWTRVVKARASFWRGARARVEAPIRALLRAAYRGAYGDAPDDATVCGWVRSFGHFGQLVSLPMARRNSERKRRDPSLRPRFYENEQFRFRDFYAESERRLVELCNLAYGYFDGGDFGRAAEDAFVRAAQIDDLAEPGLTYPERLAALPPLPPLPGRYRAAPRTGAEPRIASSARQ
jgi:hypothetical protein